MAYFNRSLSLYKFIRKIKVNSILLFFFKPNKTDCSIHYNFGSSVVHCHKSRSSAVASGLESSQRGKTVGCILQSLARQSAGLVVFGCELTVGCKPSSATAVSQSESRHSGKQRIGVQYFVCRHDIIFFRDEVSKKKNLNRLNMRARRLHWITGFVVHMWDSV